MKFGLPETVIQRIQGVFASHPAVREVLVYGSRAKGNFREGSDIDLTIQGTVDTDELDQIETELEDLVLAWTIDLSVYDNLDNPALVDHINRVGACIYKADDV